MGWGAASVSTAGNIDCGGGIAINGANAFYNTGDVTDYNEENTYINFKLAGSGSDWWQEIERQIQHKSRVGTLLFVFLFVSLVF